MNNKKVNLLLDILANPLLKTTTSDAQISDEELFPLLLDESVQQQLHMLSDDYIRSCFPILLKKLFQQAFDGDVQSFKAIYEYMRDTSLLKKQEADIDLASLTEEHRHRLIGRLKQLIEEVKKEVENEARNT